MMLTPSPPFVKERQARQGREQDVAGAEYYYFQGLCNTHCMVFFLSELLNWVLVLSQRID